MNFFLSFSLSQSWQRQLNDSLKFVLPSFTLLYSFIGWVDRIYIIRLVHYSAFISFPIVGKLLVVCTQRKAFHDRISLLPTSHLHSWRRSRHPRRRLDSSANSSWSPSLYRPARPKVCSSQFAASIQSKLDFSFSQPSFLWLSYFPLGCGCWPDDLLFLRILSQLRVPAWRMWQAYTCRV